jgi:hypothetical protein
MAARGDQAVTAPAPGASPWGGVQQAAPELDWPQGENGAEQEQQASQASALARSQQVAADTMEDLAATTIAGQIMQGPTAVESVGAQPVSLPPTEVVGIASNHDWSDHQPPPTRDAAPQVFRPLAHVAACTMDVAGCTFGSSGSADGTVNLTFRGRKEVSRAPASNASSMEREHTELEHQIAETTVSSPDVAHTGLDLTWVGGRWIR